MQQKNQLFIAGFRNSHCVVLAAPPLQRLKGSLYSRLPLPHQVANFSRKRAIALPRREKQDAVPSTGRHALAGKPTAKA